MTADRRADNIARLKSERWDVLIVGGGINGAGIARDLALRGADLKVALVEKNHFASGTSGRNSQLIHGGLRYLKYFDFGLVQEALRERATLLRIAPGLVRPLEFLLPCATRFDALFYGAGLTVYDALSGSRSIGRHYGLSGAAVRELEPALADFRSGFIFMDAAVHSARLVLENILDAQERGACVANYLNFDWRGGAIDRLSGESFALDARRIVDATGAWSEGAPLRLVRGSHLVFPRIQAGQEAICYFDADGRIVFLIPWGENNDLTLVGTTDVDHGGGPDVVRISGQEAEYLKSIVTRLFPAYQGQPVSSYSSLRPLIAEIGRSATATSREHRIWQTPDGVLHVSGGKYTTYRSMSEETVDMVLDDLLPGKALPCRTADIPLEIPVSPVGTAARVAVAVEREFARRLPDLLYTSTYWGHERPLDREWIGLIAEQMGLLLDWNRAQVEDEMYCLSQAPI